MTNTASNPFVEMFEDPERARAYADGPVRFTPGFSDMHKMVSVLLNEQITNTPTIIVHGAGGGLELAALAGANPAWQFLGVDPAKPMLDEAEARLGSLMSRVTLHHGYIDTAPEGPFDAATSLLTLHFMEPDERVETIRQIVDRLKPGAPFVAVHKSFDQSEPNRDIWLLRYEAFARASGVDSEMAASARGAVSSMTTALNPEQDIEIMQRAGLTAVSMFYSAFTWRGWVGYATR